MGGRTKTQDFTLFVVEYDSTYIKIIGPASCHGGEPETFADDLSVCKKYPTEMDAELVIEDMKKTQNEVHRWGHRNRVRFDGSKEHIVVLHPISGQGDNFQLLGCLIDVKLRMEAAVDQIFSRAKPKIAALLKTRNIYGIQNMIAQRNPN